MKTKEMVTDLVSRALRPNVFPAITPPPVLIRTYFGLVVGALSPNSFLYPTLAGFGLFLALPLLFLVVFCCAACLACSFGDTLDFSTEEGRSASVGDGLGFGLETGGGDLVKKLKRELCFAMCARFTAGSPELIS